MQKIDARDYLRVRPTCNILPRCVLLCYPAQDPMWKDQDYNNIDGQREILDVFDESGIRENTHIVTQVNTNLSGLAGFPSNVDISEGLGMAHKARTAIRRTLVPEDMQIAGIFGDHEPRYTLPNGRRKSWMWRFNYDRYDVAFADQMFDEMKSLDLPNTMYGIPIIPKARRRKWLELMHSGSHLNMLKKSDWVWMNFYPDRQRDQNPMSPRRYSDWVDCVQHNTYINTRVFQGRPCVPAIFPRFGDMANKELTNAIIKGVYDNQQIRSLLVWVNPHTPGMSRVYAEKLREIMPSLTKWIQS